MTPPLIQLPMLENPQGEERQLGSLILNKGSQKISLPLGSVDIQARVIGRVAEVTVKQVFRNNLSEHLEAVYIFPLAAGSAISSFIMKVNDRVIKGVVQERGQARRQYQQAINDGKRAALMEQERDDVFTVQVGNLPPGEEVAIEIVYSERLPFFENGASELRLPLVVAPRYMPGVGLDRDNVGEGIEADTDLVPDASRISPPRLAKGVDPQTALKLKVEILPEDGAEISDLACSQHASKAALQQGGLTVSLARADERLNRDFVLRWRSASDTVKTTLVTYKGEDGQTYGLLSVLPPKRDGYLGAARDIIFVLDRSGSMQGIKMSSAVSACSILLNTLGPQDRFAIAAFDDRVEWMPTRRGNFFAEADTAGIESGEKYLRTVTTRGGTEMDNALCHAFSALGSRNDRTGRMPSLVVLTDGEVGNESQILRRIQTEIGDARLFVVGIDTAVNAGLLKRLANLGGGTAAFVEPGIQLEEALVSIGREIGAPLVTDLQVENLDLSVDQASISPYRIPDIFAGRASVCFLKLNGKVNGKGNKICMKGKFANGKKFEERVKAQSVEMPCIAQLWAKTHIVDLEDQYRVNPNAKSHLKKEIVDLSVKHSVLTKFTAFVVVDEAEIVNKTGDLQKVVQPVEMPDAWEMAADQFGSSSLKCRSVLPQQAAGATRYKMSSKGYGGGGAGNMLNSSAPSSQPPAAQPSPSLADTIRRQAALGGSANTARNDADSRDQLAAHDASSAWSEDSEQIQTGCWNALANEAQSQDDAWAAPAAKQQDSGWGAPAPAAPMPPPAPSISQSAPTPAPAPAPAPTPAPLAEPTPPTPASTGALGAMQSFFDKLGSIGKKAPVDRKLSDEVKADLARIRALLETFLKTYESAFASVKQGNSPDVNDLESARVQLLQALAVMRLGMELPKLQRFLRAAAIELVSSLKDKSVSTEHLRSFWDEKQEIFNEAKQEIEDLLSGKEAAFWECSI